MSENKVDNIAMAEKSMRDTPTEYGAIEHALIAIAEELQETNKILKETRDNIHNVYAAIANQHPMRGRVN